MTDVAADSGLLSTTVNIIHLAQMVVQGRWQSGSSLLQIPDFTEEDVERFASQQPAVLALPQLTELATAEPRSCEALLAPVVGDESARRMTVALQNFPIVDVEFAIEGASPDKPLETDSEYTLKVSEEVSGGGLAESVCRATLDATRLMMCLTFLSAQGQPEMCE